MVTSLVIRPRVKPAENEPEMMCCLSRCSEAKFLPVDTFRMSVITSGSSPKRLPISTASQTAARPVAAT